MISWKDWKTYLLKSKDVYKQLYHASHFEEETGKGFCSYDIAKDSVVVRQLYGDGEYWFSRLKEVAKLYNCTKLTGIVNRSPKGYTRKYGAKVVGHVIEINLEEKN